MAGIEYVEDRGDVQEQIIAAIPHLRRYARVLLRNADAADADDLVQDCLLRGLAKSDGLKPGSALKPWLFTILHNLYVSRIRHLSSRQRREHLARTGATPAAMASPDQVVELTAFSDALDALPDTQRIVVLLVGLEGLTYAEVADAIGAPVGTVRSRLSRGRESLRQILYSVKVEERAAG